MDWKWTRKAFPVFLGKAFLVHYIFITMQVDSGPEYIFLEHAPA